MMDCLRMNPAAMLLLSGALLILFVPFGQAAFHFTPGGFERTTRTLPASGPSLARSSVVVLAAASKSSSSTETETLSGLVSGMLQSHQEMTKEMKHVEAHKNDYMPTVDADGVYRMVNEQQYKNFLSSHKDQLIILKFSSPYCKACKMLKTRFPQLCQDAKFANVVFGDIIVSNNKHIPQDAFTEFITTQLQVIKIPTIHFYVGSELVEEIACSPEGCSWKELKKQMVDLVMEQQQKPAAAANSSKENKPENKMASSHRRHATTPLKALRKRISGFFRHNNS